MKHLLTVLCVFAATSAFVVLSACHNPIDCTTPDKATSDAECTAVTAVVTCAEQNGTPAAQAEVLADVKASNWGDLETVAIKYGLCVVAQVVIDYIGGGAGSGSATSVAATAGPGQDTVKLHFAMVRNKLAPGREFETKAGAL